MQPCRHGPPLARYSLPHAGCSVCVFLAPRPLQLSCVHVRCRAAQIERRVNISVDLEGQSRCPRLKARWLHLNTQGAGRAAGGTPCGKRDVCVREREACYERRCRPASPIEPHACGRILSAGGQPQQSIAARSSALSTAVMIRRSRRRAIYRTPVAGGGSAERRGTDQSLLSFEIQLQASRGWHSSRERHNSNRSSSFFEKGEPHTAVVTREDDTS